MGKTHRPRIRAGPILLVLTLAYGRRFGVEVSHAALLRRVSLTLCVCVYSALCSRFSWVLVLPLALMTFPRLTGLAAAAALTVQAVLRVESWASSCLEQIVAMRLDAQASAKRSAARS